jgi:hypothetical protein
MSLASDYQFDMREVTDKESEYVAIHEEDQPTASHELADADHDEKGVAQLRSDGIEGKDLGWQEDKAGKFSETLIGGLSNEELWTLIRRFNKQIFHVKTTSDHPVSPD